MDITNAIERVQALWADVPGVRSAQNQLLDSVSQFPTALTFEGSGSLNIGEMYSGTWSDEKDTIVSVLLLARKDLPRDTDKATPLRKAFLRALQADPNLGGEVMIIQSIRWTFGPIVWTPDLSYIGYRFEIDCALELEPEE